MTCAEFLDSVELFAAGALDAGQLAALERHLVDEGPHQGCLEALRRATEAWTMLGRALPPVQTPKALWSRIEEQSGARRRPTAVPTWAGWWVAAAALIMLVLVTGMRSRQVQQAIDAARRSDAERQACTQELAALRSTSDAQREALALLAAPDTKVVQFAPPAPGSPLNARALVNLAQRKGFVYSAALAPQQGKDYELWLIRGEQKVPAGLLRATAAGQVVASIDPQLLGTAPDALAVTLEPEGGSPQPRGAIVLVAPFPKV